MNKVAVTVGKSTSPGLVQQALDWSEQLGLPYLPRLSGTLEELLAEHGLTALLVATARGPELHSPEGRLFFHPSMGLLRIKSMLAGQQDRLVTTMGLQAGMSVLDCSFGLGADALVLTFAAGKTGRVVALEASPLLAFVMQAGLRNYRNELLAEPLQRLQLVSCEAVAYLRSQPDNAFDIVYFDPMFDYEIGRSSNMKPLRPFAYDAPLAESFLEQAQRVARSKVVVKLVRESKLFTKFALQATCDGKYSKIKYAVLEVGK